MTWSRCCARLVFSTSRKIARRPGGRGRSGSGGGTRAANVDSTAETGSGKGSGSASTRGATGSGAGSSTTGRRGRSAGLRRPRALDAGRDALPRVFFRFPSRLELVVTVRLSVTHDGRFPRGEVRHRAGRSPEPARRFARLPARLDVVGILPQVMSDTLPPIGQPLRLMHPVL